jgi:predicted metal-dependent HD superfamily phosphohydrolase
MVTCSLCLTNWAQWQEDVWGSGFLDSRFLDLSATLAWVTTFTSRPFYLWEIFTEAIRRVYAWVSEPVQQYREEELDYVDILDRPAKASRYTDSSIRLSN